MVEIAKALGRGARMVAFDEPTSSLSAKETRRLFEIIRDLRDRGAAVLYVTHRMDEVYELCDAATVLRDGRHVVTHETLAHVTRDALVSSMVGRELTNIYHYRPRPHAPGGLEVRALAGPRLRAPVSFQVARGEVVGFFGLVGAGRTELMRLICGATAPTAGEVRVRGATIRRCPGRPLGRADVLSRGCERERGDYRDSIRGGEHQSQRPTDAPSRVGVSLAHVGTGQRGEPDRPAGSGRLRRQP